MSENQKNGPDKDPGNGQDNGQDNGQGNGKTDVLTKTRPKTKKPSMYKVLMLNDDYTPMDFVVHTLLAFFKKSEEEAVQIMMNVHQKGSGICGVYSFEVAESKVVQVIDYARRNDHPLQCTLEKD